MKCKKHSNRVNTPFGDFQIDMDNLVDHFFGGPVAKQALGWSPRTSVVESDTEYRMVVELPGLSVDEVNVEVKDGVLEISGEKKTEELAEGFRLVRDERRVGEFRRSFEFSTVIDAEQIEASFKNGLLTLVLPKSAKVLPRKIAISVEE